MLKMNDGRDIPQLGFGTWQVSQDEAARVTSDGLVAGYRLIDTAEGYENEEGVGAGLAQSGVAREDIFVTTKLTKSRHGFDEALRACDDSLGRLGLEYLDLYLIHWPLPSRDLYADTWRAFVRLREEGKARSIGVSNFTAEHLDRIIGETGVTPAVNQIELHPKFQQRGVRDFHARHDILIESWSPLGRGGLLGEAAIIELAVLYGKTPAQAIIRWHIQQGLIVIPKSMRAARLAENFDVFDFELSEADMDLISGLDTARGRTGPDPDRMRG
jgi:2,5-diketo-D-gluconate reductase A